MTNLVGQFHAFSCPHSHLVAYFYSSFCLFKKKRCCPQQFWRCTYWSNPLTQFPPNPGLAWVVTHPGLCSCKCACPKIMTKLRLTNSFPHASQQVILGMHNLDLCCCSCTNNQSATATSSATAERLWFCSMYPSDSVPYVFLNSNMYFSVFLMFFFKSVTVFFRFHIF